MVHNKSDCVFIPKVIPDGLIIHFIRGYFDGDGCLCRRTKKPIFTFGIVSKSKLIIEQISAFFKKKYEIHISIYYNKSKNIYKLGVCGNQKAYKIMSLIYTNATIYLNRKYNKYLELIQIMSSHQEQKTSKYKNISHNKKENVWVVVYQNNKTIYYIARCKTEKKAIEALTQWKQNNINLLRINE